MDKIWDPAIEYQHRFSELHHEQCVPSLWEFVEILLERLVALPADIDNDDVAALVDAAADDAADDDTAVRVGLEDGDGVARSTSFHSPCPG